MKKAILINDTSDERHIGCDNVIKNIKYLCRKNNIEITTTFTRADINKHSAKCFESMKTCDIIIINGEGSLHDKYGRKWFIKVLKLIPKNKKAVLINSVWHNMGKITELNKLSLVSVRELNSYESLTKTHPKLKKVRIVPDVLFYIQQMPKKLNIGYGDSVSSDITDKLKCHANYFPLQYNKVGKPKYPSELAKNDIYSYLNWLKSLDLHITGRFHGVCLSAMAGTPFLALASNARKIEGILRDMGCSELLITAIKDKKAKKAQKLILNALNYAHDAPKKIEALFETIGKIAHEK